MPEKHDVATSVKDRLQKTTDAVFCMQHSLVEISDAEKIPAHPMVSVCVITYNHAPYIRECLDSILSQKTSFEYEICIGEDESSDGTREICREYAKQYPSRIRLFLRSQSEPSRVSYLSQANYNVVETYKASRGKYVAVCEGDDFWHCPEKLQLQVEYMESHPDCSMCHSGTDYLDMITNQHVKDEFKSRFYNQPDIGLSHVIGDYVVRTCTILCRADALKSIVETHHLEYSNFVAGDILTVFHLSQFGLIHFLSRSLATYRRTPGSATGIDNLEKRYRFFYLVSDERGYLCMTYGLSCLEYVIQRDLRSLLKLAHTLKDHQKARDSILLCSKYGNALSLTNWLFSKCVGHQTLYGLLETLRSNLRDMKRVIRHHLGNLRRTCAL